ncbi:MAG: haloacid dehalogenase-like hydrolase [Clostridiales bacterium]|nr:haloacid dehalogenase-like hydrolase [Clostridia bacterium]MCR5353145.1 haloacid dehalogenase-like hydrolase [Clostridiales bacterium]
MNVYDFDNTIYKGESLFDFYFFCLRRDIRFIKFFFAIIYNVLKYEFCLISNEKLMKLCEKYIFDALDMCPVYDEWVEDFWDKNIKKIKPFYLAQKKEDDVILSASFGIMLRPVCRRLGISEDNLLCSEVDIKEQKIIKLCFRKTKPEMFDQKFGDVKIDNFYTDSFNDRPFIERAEKSFIVKGNKMKEIKNEAS